MRRLPTLLVATIAVLALMIAGCTQAAPPAPTQAPPAPAKAGEPAKAAQPVATTAAAPAKTQPIRVRVAHTAAETHADQVWSLEFKKVAEEKSGGRFDVQVFPNSVLGDQQRLFESARLGNLEVAIGGIPPSQWVPSYGIQQLPYLYRDVDHYIKAIEGPIADDIIPKLEKENMKFLGRVFIGVRHMTNNKRPINTPDDMKGLKMRTVDTPVYHEMFKALGAAPVPVSFSELYSGLKQGVADGQDNPVGTIRAQKLFEVQKYLSLTAHVYGADLNVYSLMLFNSLSPDLQQIILDAGRQATLVARKWVLDQEHEDLNFIKSQGMIVNQPPSLDPFIKATINVADVVKNDVPPELVEKVRNIK